jgi:hypothetical protein
MPVWFMAVPGPNTVVLLWQFVQSIEVVMWLAAFVTGVTFWNVWPPWQLAQVPLTTAWLIVAVAKLVKLVWQLTQSPVVVKWVVPFETGLTPFWKV